MTGDQQNGPRQLSSTTSGRYRAWVWVAFGVAVAAAFAARWSASTDPPGMTGAATMAAAADDRGRTPTAERSAATDTTPLPRLVDLGAGKCIPCKMMAPILAELRTACSGRLQVDFIDVWEQPDQAKQYGIAVIPTQIFYDATGRERFRHEGFYSKSEILAKWQELGVDLARCGAAGSNTKEARGE